MRQRQKKGLLGTSHWIFNANGAEIIKGWMVRIGHVFRNEAVWNQRIHSIYRHPVLCYKSPITSRNRMPRALVILSKESMVMARSARSTWLI
jgi:hypothetical protein